MKTIFATFAVFWLVMGLTAQEKFKVSGNFYDDFGNLLPGVYVLDKGTQNGANTNFEGYYEIYLEEGEHTLVFNFLAPNAIERSFFLKKDMVLDVRIGEKVQILDEVFVSAIRATSESPVTFTNFTKEEIAPRNLGQDIPILMNFLPSVVTTSDAGAGVGYTGIRVRGSDATRVNVTINGIPYNDSESHGTFWVNMPDFASSTENLQLQRGVGTSTNGAGAFGASLNILTDGISEDAFGQISSSFGSFNTLRNSLKFSTGLLNEHIEISGRLSRITSDGYVDRASSKLDSYFLQGTFKDDKSILKALLFGGHEITYQSWNGVDAETLANERTFNSAGIYTDEGGNTQFYENEVDNYKQNHAQLLYNRKLSENWSGNIALHYTRGRGFFEQFKEDEEFSDYGIEEIITQSDTINTTDLIRRRWLDNHFYGTVFSANYRNEKLDFVLGGGWNKYEGGHFGEITWARFSNNRDYLDRYYDDNSVKTDFNIFVKANYQIHEKWNIYGDLQYRTVGYQANGEDTGIVDDTFNFFNPKVGVTYDLNANCNLYFSYAVANREPNRNDYEDGNPKPEKLDDFELGWRYVTSDIQLSTNVYYMKYKDQLVLTGELNDVGAPRRANVGDSYRLGLEIDASIALGSKFRWQPNIAVSGNKNVDFFFENDGLLQSLGNTNIVFSPNIIAGNRISYLPDDNLRLSLLTKYVGKQYMSNIDSEASVLDAYSQSDFNVSYEVPMDSVIKSIVFSGLVNNIFNAEFESNGADYGGGFIYYYPQAGTNFLIGAAVSF